MALKPPIYLLTNSQLGWAMHREGVEFWLNVSVLCPIPEKNNVLLTSMAHTQSDSLVYGADWSWLYIINRFQPNLDPSLSSTINPFSKALTRWSENMNHAQDTALLSIQSPFWPIQAKDQSRVEEVKVVCESNSSLDIASFDINLLATCSFYDHALQFWKYDSSSESCS